MTLYDLKRKINSIKSTGQVTKALQIIAATKQKRIQKKLVNSRYMLNALRNNLIKIQRDLENSVSIDELPIFFKSNGVSRALIITVMSQKGLCGGLNSKLFYKVMRLKSELKKKKIKVDFISINKMAQKYLSNSNQNIKAYFDHIPEIPTYDDIVPIIDLIKDLYNNKQYGWIYLSYSNFIKTGIYEAKITQLLPLNLSGHKNTITSQHYNHNVYLIEPSPLETLKVICDLYIELEIFEAILSSSASENTARMLSMKKATDNIKNLTEKFTLELNKIRQAKVTQQACEITAALKPDTY